MGKPMVIVSAAGCVLVAGTWILLRARPAPAAQTTAPSKVFAEDTTALASGMNELRRDVAVLRLENARLSARGGEEVVASPKGASVPSFQTREEAAEYAAEQRAKLKEHLGTVLAQETRDGKWASETEQVARDTVRVAEPDARVEDAACGTTMCRVVVRHTDETNQRHLADRIADKAPFSPGTFYSYDKLVTTMYVAREGHPLPAAPE